MRKHFLLKTMLLLCALIVGSSSAWAEEVTVSMTSFNAISADMDDYISYEAAKGNAATAPAVNNNEIRIYQNGGTFTVSAKNDAKINSITLGSSMGTTVTYSVDGGTASSNMSISENGTITVNNLDCSSVLFTCTGTSKTTRLYVNSLSVTYTTGSSTPSITAEDVSIFDDATAGSISYTVNHPVEGGVLTAARTVEADTWLTVGNVSATAVAFTTTVNTGAERSTNVRLTYTYNTNQTVTKDVTITQAAPTIEYTVTIENPTGGTLVVKQGETTVNSGDKFPEGTVLNVTATANDRYKFRNWQAIDVSTHTFSSSNTGTYTMTANDLTIKANFDAREYHNATFSVNGTAGNPVEYEKGTSIVFPSNPADVEGKKFVGWTTATITGVTDEAPTMVTSAQMGDDDITFYAVFADAEGDGEESITYEKLSTNNFDANATYVVGAMNGNNLDLFYSYSNVDSNSSWGKMSSNYTPLTFTLSGTASKLYAKDNNGNYLQGDVNDFRMVSENNKAPIVLGNDGKIYNYNSGNTSTKWLRYNTGSGYGLRWYATTSTTGILAYFYKRVVDPGYTYSNYCTTVAPDERLAVNMTSFTATNTTLVIGGTPNTTTTTVANDQSGWTAAYTYESDNTGVATIDANGVITAVAKGTANITATLNVDKNDENYKAGATKSISIEITVVNPSHDVTFYDNGTHLDAYDETYEEGEDIIFPDAPTAAVSGYSFIGWATAAIDGTATEAPTTVTSATMGTANVTYYAVYGNIEKTNVTATFDAADISNLTASATRTWTDNATGISLYISSGQRYIDGTPNTWTINSGSNYLLLYKENAQLTRVEVTVTGSNYKVSKYKVYEDDNDNDGSDLTSSVSNSGNVYTLDITGKYEQIGLWANNNQVRATKIVVDAITEAVTGYVTSFPTTATITLSAACTDGDMVYGTYSSSKAFVVSDDIIVSEIGIVDGKLWIENYETGDVVPANTGVLVSALEGGNYTVDLSNEAGTSILGDDNCLRPSGDNGVTAADMADPDYYYYRLTMADGQPGFWWKSENGAGFTLAANKAYMKVLKTDAAAARGFSFTEDVTTGVEGLKNSKTEELKSYYNIAGQRVAQPTKGLYIVNGKKVVIK